MGLKNEQSTKTQVICKLYVNSTLEFEGDQNIASSDLAKMFRSNILSRWACPADLLGGSLESGVNRGPEQDAAPWEGGLCTQLTQWGLASGEAWIPDEFQLQHPATHVIASSLPRP